MSKRKRYFWALVVGLVGCTVWGLTLVGTGDGTPEESGSKLQGQPAGLPVGPEIPQEYQVQRIERSFPPRSTLRDVLFEYDFTPADLHQLIEETRNVYDLNKVKAGHRLVIERFYDGRLRKLEYDIDETEYLEVYDRDGTFEAVKGERIFDVVRAGVSGRIADSLWNTLLAQGESGELVMKIYEVMQWDIDFTTIQPGDSFKIVFDKLFYEGDFRKYGEVKALKFWHGGRTFHAFQYHNPEVEKTKYYDLEGKGVKKAFLKVPFHYDYRISSGFSHSRLHPVHGVRRPHYGVDYAAPHGTPVLASASGRVIFAGWKGANGNLVKIRHPNGYVTYYLHLSKILVKSGQSVQQGDRIGRVGATGTVTGTHLDYRIQDQRGRFINPKKYVALPSDKAVSEDLMDDYEQVRDDYLRLLEEVPLPPPLNTGVSVAG